MGLQEDTREVLIDKGLSNIFIGNLVDEIEEQTVIYSGGGGGQSDDMDGNFFEQVIKVITKGVNISELSDRNIAVRKALHNVTGEELKVIFNNTNIVGYRILSDVVTLGQDERGRHMYSFSFVALLNDIL